MRRILFALFLVFAVALIFAGTAKADTIMFPYINTNPGNVSTIISVINGNSVIGGSPVGALHYRYFTKPHSAGTLDPCEELDFCRVTSVNDVVTFDVTGNSGAFYNSGNAMFGDPGAGATFGGTVQATYEGPFNNAQTPQPRIGYLLVTHHMATGFGNVGCSAGDILLQGELDGEATLIDIVNGEAWGYRAAQNSTTGTGDTSSNYSFRTSDERLIEDGDSFFENTVIWPPNQFKTKYFVTPLFIRMQALSGGTNAGPSDNMADPRTSWQKRVKISLRGWAPFVGGQEPMGMFNRDEGFVSGGNNVHVRCVAAINLIDIIGSAAYSTLSSTGGWATVDLQNPTPIAADNEGAILNGSYDAFVYDLKFGQLPGVTGLTNDGKVIRTRDANAGFGSAPRDLYD